MHLTWPRGEHCGWARGHHRMGTEQGTAIGHLLTQAKPTWEVGSQPTTTVIRLVCGCDLWGIFMND